MPYVPPYTNIDDRGARSALNSDIYESEQAIADIDNNISQAEERLARYRRDGQTTQANLLQATIDDQKAIKARRQEQLDGARNDLAIVDGQQKPIVQGTNTAEFQVTNDQPSGTETTALTEEEATTLEENAEAPPEEDPVGLDTEVGETDETITSDATVLDEDTGNSLTTGNINVTADPLDPDNTVTIESLENILHQFPSYTYGISLHALSADDYNNLVKDQNYLPGNVLIASAGRYNNTVGTNQFIRNKAFGEDFYFEDLEIKTIIGLNERNRDTNAVDLNFKVIEPYGVTLFNRILDVAQMMKVDNYLEMPYLIQIDFFATNEVGEVQNPIPSITKRIPIRLIDFQINISNKGSEYGIQAIPFNHSAYFNHTMTTPVNFEVRAGTVADFFDNNKRSDYIETLRKNQEREGQVLTGYYDENGNKVLVPAFSFDKTKGKSFSTAAIYRVQSYAAALNAWQKDLEDNNKIQFADQYEFSFDPKIGQKAISTGNKISSKEVPMADKSRGTTIRRDNTGEATSVIDFNNKITQINAGTTIESVISRIVRNSNYILDQIIVPEDYGDNLKRYQEAKKAISDEPLQWFRIVPEIQILGYDKKRKSFARKITYHVRTYEIRNLKVDFGPQGKASRPLKVYEYIYTGRNKDILDFDIQFNALFYTQVQAYRNKLMALSGAADDKELAKTEEPDYDPTTGTDPNAVQPLAYKPDVGDQQDRATAQGQSTKASAAADLSRSILSDARGDMIKLDLKIIGDPAFIKQDDVYYRPERQQSKTNPDQKDLYTPNGSIITDTGEVYVQLTFRTPTDLDEETGMMKFDGRYETSVFSGLYRVLTVDNYFRQGRFEQMLTLVRLFDQTRFDYVDKGVKDTNKERLEGLPSADVGGPSAVTEGDAVGPDFTPETDDDQLGPAPDSDPVEDQEADDAIDSATLKEQNDLRAVDETAEEESIIDRINNQPQNSPSTTVKTTEEEWLDRSLENQAKQDALTAELREANREYRTATTAYNLYGEQAFRTDTTLRGRLEQSVDDRQRILAELKQLEQERTAIDANKP